MEEFIPYVEPVDPNDIEDEIREPKKKKPHNGRIGRERDKQIVIRMSEKELEQFHERIALTNLKQNDFIINALLKRKIVVVDNSGIKELRDEIRKIGINLNQVARHFNQAEGNYNKQMVDELKAVEVALWQSLRTMQTPEVKTTVV